MHKRFSWIIVITLAIALATSSVGQTVIFQDAFEVGKIQQWDQEFCCQHSLNLVITPHKSVRKGDNSVKFELSKNDPELNLGKRAELALKSVSFPGEYIYEFSLFLPLQYATDTSFEILAQWHGLPDFDLGETWRSPPLALVTQDGKFKLERNWDDQEVTVNYEQQKELVELHPYVPGIWTDWKFQVKWSYQADGIIRVWQNQNLVFEHQGANTYNDRQGTYFKIGIYKPDWKYNPDNSVVENRTVYFDDILITRN